MSGIEAFFLWLMNCGVWFGFAIQCGRLYKAFLAKYPLDAQKLIPYAFSATSHPEKFLFFFRRIAQPYLKSVPKLWELKRQFVVMLWLSFLVPVAIMGLFMILAMTDSHR